MDPVALPEKIEADRIFLQKHSIEIAEAMYAAVDCDRKRLGEFLPWVDKNRSVQDQRDYIQITHENWARMDGFDFSILRKSDGTYIGNIGIHSIAWNHNRCELGYWIAGPFEGQGFITEAVTALEKSIFDLGFNRIEICCSSLNERSANVPRRCGYKHEGTLRQDAIENGHYRNTMIFAKLKSDCTICTRQSLMHQSLKY